MSETIERHILSSPNPEDPRPWFDFDIDPDSLDLEIREGNGVAAFARANGHNEVAPDKEHGLKGKQKIRVKNKKEKSNDSDGNEVEQTEMHVLAVTLEGDIEFVPASEQKAIYYAHLAFYYPDTKTLIINRFHPGGI